jgi:hypothetical protein
LFMVGLRWGPVGVALAWTMSFWILTVPAFSYAGKPINLGVGSMIAAVWKYILGSLVAGVMSYLILREVLPPIPDADSVGATMHVVIGSAVFAALYLGAVIALHGGFAPLYRVWGLFQDMIPWRRVSRNVAFVATAGGGDEV